MSASGLRPSISSNGKIGLSCASVVVSMLDKELSTSHDSLSNWPNLGSEVSHWFFLGLLDLQTIISNNLTLLRLKILSKWISFLLKNLNMTGNNGGNICGDSLSIYLMEELVCLWGMVSSPGRQRKVN